MTDVTMGPVTALLTSSEANALYLTTSAVIHRIHSNKCYCKGKNNSKTEDGVTLRQKSFTIAE